MSDSIAVFVDAGYLFAQGATALSGTTHSRSSLKLDEGAVSAALRKVALDKGQGCRLLRIYWYDGSSSGQLSADQFALASSDDIKLRLGQINSVGQQKGVDSLIVTDLIELARNRAISDALLVSGDEDVRIGVQIAQSFGVRVHLLGIDATKKSQSPLLIQESDTTSLWQKADVASFLTIKRQVAISGVASLIKAAPPATLEDVAVQWALELDADQIQSFAEFRKKNNSIPSDLDGKLLGKARTALGKDLSQDEKRRIRGLFVDAAKKRRPGLFER